MIDPVNIRTTCLMVCPTLKGEHVGAVIEVIRWVFEPFADQAVSLAALQEVLARYPDGDHAILEVQINGEQFCRVRLVP